MSDLSLWRLARGRLVQQAGLSAALAAGLAAAVGIAAMVPLADSLAAEVGIRQALAGLADGGSILVQDVRATGAPDYDRFQADAERQVSRSLGIHVRPGPRLATIGPFTSWTVHGVRVTANPRDSSMPRPVLGYDPDLAGHVDVVTGALPRDEATTGDHPAAVSAAGAGLLGLGPGDQLCVGVPPNPRAPATRSFCVRVAAIWRPHDPHDRYWVSWDSSLDLMLSRADLFAAAALGVGPPGSQQVVATHLFHVALDTIDAQNAPRVAQRIHELRGYFDVRHDDLFLTGVDTALVDFVRRQQAAAATIELVAVGLLLVALYAVSFVTGHFLETQAGAVSVLRSRGWRRRRVWAFLGLQLAGLALVALPAGLGLAALATLALSRFAFGLTTPVLDAPDLLAVVPALAMALVAGLAVLGTLAASAARRDLRELRGSATRPPAAWWRWRNADLLTAVVALALLAEPRLSAGGAAGDDLLSLALPALTLALLAVAGLRLLPVASSLVLRLAAGVAASLAGWQLRRRSAQHASLAVMVTVAVAMCVFSSIYATTDHRNALDRAAYGAGADVRVTYATPVPRLDPLLASLPAGSRGSVAYRDTVYPGASGVVATALALDPASFPAVAWSRPGLTSGLSRLTDRLAAASPDGLALPGRPASLSVQAFGDGADVHLVADVADAAGRPVAGDLGTLGPGSWRRLTAALRFSGGAAPTYPLRLLDISVNGGRGGRVALSDLAAGDQVVEPFDRASGWWAQTGGLDGDVTDIDPTPAPPRAGQPVQAAEVDLNGDGVVVRPALSQRPLPAVVSNAMLASLGIGLHQPFPIHFASTGIQVTAIAATDYFPTLYPGDQFLVLPRDPVLLRLARAGVGTAPNELWLHLTGPSAEVADHLYLAGPTSQLDDRRQLQAAALTDPLRLALDGTLAAGFLATLAMAVLTLAIHFATAARGRLAEYAILRANGLSPATVGRSLLLEQTVLLLHGLAVGTALGIALAYTLLPALRLGDAAQDVVPPTVITMDPVSLSVVALSLLVGGFAAGWLASRAGDRLDVRAQLRQLG